MFRCFPYIKRRLAIQSCFCCLFLMCIHITLYAQQLSSSSKKAIREYHAGYDDYTRRQYQKAIERLENAVGIAPDFIEAHLLMAECYLEIKEPRHAQTCFLNCVKINPDFFPPIYYSLAEIEFEAGEFEEASVHLEKYLTYGKQKPALRAKSEKMLQNSRFAAQAVKNPVPFEPENLGFDFGYDQYWPTLSIDEQTLVFTALIPKNPDNPAVFGNQQEDFFVSNFRDGKWNNPESLGTPPNTPDNEGAQAISTDAARMFFTACNRSDGKGGCDIYYSEKRNGLWTRPLNLGDPVNTSAKETQPSIATDGRTLYFVSNRGGGKGGQDIWISTLNNNGRWSNPINLEEINTPDDESSPFIHPDSRTLYFASGGWPGMGQYDLFVTRKDTAGNWSMPENLGYPINSKYNEEGMVVNARGNRAYYSSDCGEGNIRNIFTFELYPAARPQPVSYMKGKIYDAKSLKPLKAFFELIDLSSANKVVQAQSDSTSGEFLVCIPSGKNYALNIQCKDYLFFSEHFTMTGGSYLDPFQKDIPLKRIQPGEKLILKNVFFDFASAKLMDASKAELDRLAQFLRNHPAVKIRITGHTDNVGTKTYNLALSQNRARTVANYLLNEGIAMNRVGYKGLGSLDPVTENETEEGRAQNRRTELLIVE